MPTGRVGKSLAAAAPRERGDKERSLRAGGYRTAPNWAPLRLLYRFEDHILEKLFGDAWVKRMTGSYGDTLTKPTSYFYREGQSDARRYYLIALTSDTGDTLQEISSATHEALAVLMRLRASLHV
jgi:hypothetical protein